MGSGILEFRRAQVREGQWARKGAINGAKGRKVASQLLSAHRAKQQLFCRRLRVLLSSPF